MRLLVLVLASRPRELRQLVEPAMRSEPMRVSVSPEGDLSDAAGALSYDRSVLQTGETVTSTDSSTAAPTSTDSSTAAPDAAEANATVPTMAEWQEQQAEKEGLTDGKEVVEAPDGSEVVVDTEDPDGSKAVEEEKEKEQKTDVVPPKVPHALPTMKWISAHLESLMVDLIAAQTIEGKKNATFKNMQDELRLHEDREHNVNVMYLQSLGYDMELAPSTIDVGGKPVLSYAINDMVGLQDLVGGGETSFLQDSVFPDVEPPKRKPRGRGMHARQSGLKVRIRSRHDPSSFIETTLYQGDMLLDLGETEATKATDAPAQSTPAPDATTTTTTTTTTIEPSGVPGSTPAPSSPADVAATTTTTTTTTTMTTTTSTTTSTSTAAGDAAAAKPDDAEAEGATNAASQDGDLVPPEGPPVENPAEPAVEKPDELDWHLWPYGEVPYTVSTTVTQCGASALRAAIFVIEQQTCVRFKEVDYTSAEELWKNMSSNAPMLLVTSETDTGCFAGLGYKTKHREHNLLNIGEGCAYPGILLHQLGHVLGMAHEHARYDRDLFVTVKWSNLVSQDEYEKTRTGKVKGNFRVLKGTNTSWEATSQFLEYDFGSIMHFGQCEFSTMESSGQDCIEAPSLAATDYQDGEKLMGNRQVLSAKDVAVLNSMYGCHETCADKKMNQEETEVDCGGPNCPPCGLHQTKMADDCEMASPWNAQVDNGNGASLASLLLAYALHA